MRNVFTPKHTYSEDNNVLGALFKADPANFGNVALTEQHKTVKMV